MNGVRQFVTFALACFLLTGLACEKKKNVATSAAVQGPRVAPTLSEPLPSGLPSEHVPEVAKEEPPAPPPKVASKPKAKTRSRKQPVVTTQTTPTNGNPAQPAPEPQQQNSNSVVASVKPPKSPVDAAAESAIGADVPTATMVAQRDRANHDIDSAETELKSIESRQLSGDEQSILSQVKSYITQSRKALADGDYERAMNLANKAKLLTDALKKM